MAISRKQAIMVIQQEGMTTSALAPQTSPAHSLFVVLKPLHPDGGGQDKGALMANKDSSPLGTSTVGFQKRSSMSLSAMAGTNSSNPLPNFPAECTCKGITVTLDNNNMWNEFYRCQTEMILTKPGRRMFPYCRFRISGLEPFQRYTLVMDMHPADNYRYKWSDRRWETNGKCDPHISRSFVHPESPATGLNWMQNPVSFYKLKLTNNHVDQEGHIIIHSMHRYLPRLHIVPAETDTVQLNGPDVITFSFPQTEFFAVTAYQNLCITQLKIDYNPFAKGFRDDATNYRSLKPKNGLSSETMESESKPSRETTTLNNLKTLFAKRNAAGKVLKAQPQAGSTNENIKAVSADAPKAAEVEKTSSKKRPWAEGLSELMKGAHVKVKRISPEKIPDASDQHRNTCSLPAGEEKMAAASKDSKMEISAVIKEETEVKRKPEEESETVDDVKHVTEAEGPSVTSTVHVSKATDLFTLKCEPEASSEATNMQTDLSNEVISDKSINEKVDTAMSETATVTVTDGTSQSVVKPLDCGGEVKKKRAEPVPLPLLALFLQQLKSKTRSTKPKSKCETSKSPTHSDKSCKTTSPPTESLSSSVTTQLNSQPEALLTSESTTSPILTCTVANTTPSPCLSLLPTTLVTSPTSPDMPTPLKPTLVTDQDQVSDPTLAENKAVLTLDSNPNISTASSANDFSDEVLVCKQEDLPSTLSAFADNTTPKSPCTTPYTDVSNVLTDGSCAFLPSSPSDAFAATMPDASKNEVICGTVISPPSTADPQLNSCTVPCPDFVPEAHCQSPLSDEENNDEILLPQSSPEFSPPSPTPSSPDPFPPDLFTDRPIPPRKSIDPFPLDLLLNRPIRPRTSPETLQQNLLVINPSYSQENSTKCDEKDKGPACPGDSSSRIESSSSKRTCSAPALDICISKKTKQSSQDSASKKSKAKHKKSGKSKLSDNAEVTEGPIPVPMQPNLEDVEGQLFVSFMSKKALEIHLGDETKEDDLQKPAERADREVCENIEESIEAYEKILLRDLKIMKHRQVIHPVLQEVGLKLNLLDLSLAIDLQYLGVSLPIPPPIFLSGRSSGSSSSSQLQFVSRTGKTTDFTKIKGWREKFTTPSSTSLPGGPSSDAVQKNLSAFCSDMLDEYLESEGKLIDERAASFSQATGTPVAYQLPTKSTSYVRTLDSVLKKQTPLSKTTITLTPFSASTKSTLTSKRKGIVKLGDNASKKSLKSAAAKPTSKNGPKVGENSSKKSKKADAVKPGDTEPSDPLGLSPNKKSKAKIITKKESKTSQVSLLPEGKPVTNSVLPTVGRDSTSSISGGRISGLSKTLVKLLDVEDGAVWEGKRRTCITEERAAIALSSLVTAEGSVKGCPSTIIRRRAPPCLNDFCRLGCVCASLAQEKRQHHCGKPQCMLGCDCLRRKVVLLKKYIEDDDSKEGLQCLLDEDGSVVTKKKRKKKAYILSSPEVAPEPVTHVKRLWDQKIDSDLECLFIPVLARPSCSPLLSPERHQDLDHFLQLSPKKAISGEGLHMNKDKESLMTCARARPFCRTNLSTAGQHGTKVRDEDNPRLGHEDSQEDMEEGELRPPVLSGPTKRLEIVSKCKWSTAGRRNVVLRVVCDHMAHDRLKHPFWVGKYRIQPISKTVEDTDEGSTITYKVSISQPKRVKSAQKKDKNDNKKNLEAQLVKTIGQSEVKGLPLLSQVTPAGLLKAEKKPTGAPGLITVNGKSYPEAKLELGQMGALHPANRLAAYITGRVCLTKENTTKTVTTATISKTSPTAPVTSTAVITKTAKISTHASTGCSVTPIVTTPPGETVLTQVVINHLNSVQQKLPSITAPQLLRTIKHLINPPSSSTTGVTLLSVSSNTPLKANTASQAPAASDPTGVSVQMVNTAPVSESAAPVKKTFLVSSTRPQAVGPGGPVRLMQTVTSPQSAAPGQRMVFQMLRTSSGGTMYRSPNGQLVHLVPLSQFKALNPNFLISKQTTVVRLPPPTASHLQNDNSSSSAATSFTPATSTTPVLQNLQNLTPVQSNTTINPATTTFPPSLSAPKSMLSQPSTSNTVPELFSSAGKDIQIVPQSVLVVDKDSEITVTTSASSNQHTLNVNQSSLSTQSQASVEVMLDSDVQVSSYLTVGSEQDSVCSKKASESVVLEDHCYTSEASNTLIKDLMEFGPVEDDDDDYDDAAILPKVDDESKAFDLEEEEIDSDNSELTDDSDMYDGPESSKASDQEDLCIDTDSENEQKHDQDQFEKDDDVLVDIETFDERDESRKQPKSHQNKRAEIKDEKFLSKKKKQEMERRITLKDCFNKMRLTLNKDEKVSKTVILTLAREEIMALNKQSDNLVKLQKRLRQERSYYLQIASQISGKSEESISQKLEEIVAKQKALESQKKANNISSRFTPSVPKPKKSCKKMDSKGKVKHSLHRHAHLPSNSKPVDLSITKQKNLRSQDIQNVKQKTPKAHRKKKGTVWTPDKQLVSSSQPTQLSLPPSSDSREKIRPNILSRNKSQASVSPVKEQVLQVIPVETVVPCNQIITISNPLQPIGISSLGTRQSITPGVAAVSVSVPAMSHPIRVENPVPSLQPQVLVLTKSPLITPDKAVNLPKISSVVSLVPPEKLHVNQAVVVQQTDIPAVAQTQAACIPECVEAQQDPDLTSSNGDPPVGEGQSIDNQLLEAEPEQPEEGNKGNIRNVTNSQKDEAKLTASSEAEDENLMSLLDELVFLNQHLTDESSQPEGGAVSLTKEGSEQTDLSEKEKDLNRDDEPSYSPLFLRLDEDLMASTTSKDVLDDIPPKVDDLVKVIFGSDSPPNSSESEAVAGTSDDHVPGCSVPNDAPSPPPLLQMKAGSTTTTNSLNEQASVSWRPMPKLAPLGLKTQEAGQPKAGPSPPALKPGSKLPSLHSAHM